MNWISQYIWVIPAIPLVAAGVSACAGRSQRRLAASLAIGSMAAALVLSWAALVVVLRASPAGGAPIHLVQNFRWLQFGEFWLRLGWVLDPLGALMLVMVSLVGLLIFVYSVGYMAADANFTRFFCFLSLFGAAMLGLVIANSLLLLFVCWELVGLTSYLLIGFWFHKPAAAAAAKKAFLTTRVGDLALLLGMVWLYGQSGTVLFYDGGHGCLEGQAAGALVQRTAIFGLTVSSAIGLLIFVGAMGKSGQVPLHVWLPDAMEGPTPVSALIHAATMVAAGVFLVARVYPLMTVPTLQAVTWVGAVTALFAASIAVAQTDLKRILAYSTVSQLGFMMMGLGVGGVTVGMFHLLTHAFFKALLFLGAGSVIHGCHEEQDIRRLGGLRCWMPVTFATYAVGMMALSGVPLLFSGFWSKDAILHSAHSYAFTHWPFYLGLAAAFLTAFYMTRQVIYTFFGASRLPNISAHATPHESPAVMTVPLVILAVFSILMGFLGTPAWPWLQSFIDGKAAALDGAAFREPGVLPTMVTSAILALGGIAAGWAVYRRLRPGALNDPLARWFPTSFRLLERKYFVDEAYGWAIGGLNQWWGKACDATDRLLSDVLLQLAAYAAIGVSWLARLVDEYVVNLGFDRGCGGLKTGGGRLSGLRDGQVQRYLRLTAVATAALVLVLIWGCRGG